MHTVATYGTVWLVAAAASTCERRLCEADERADARARGDADDAVALGRDALVDGDAEAAAEAYGVARGKLLHEGCLAAARDHAVDEVEGALIHGPRDRVCSARGEHGIS